VPKSAFTVTILRDPVQRVVSHYSYLSDDTADLGNRFIASDYAKNLVAGGLDNFLDRAAPSLLMNQLYMFSEGLDPAEGANRIRGLSMYFYSESYDEGLIALRERLALPLVVRRERVSSATSVKPDDAVTARLREILEPEYRMMALLQSNPGQGFVGRFPN
jgi:hypothetical protein